MDTLEHAAHLMYGQRKDNSELKPCGLDIYVWDMDETLILLKSLLDGTFAESFGSLKDINSGKEIGKQWESFILHVCDELFFYEQIENYNQPFLEYLKEYDDGRNLTGYDFSKDDLSSPCDDPNKKKLAYRYRLIAEKYSQGLRKFYNEGYIKLWDELYNQTDSYTEGWLSSARVLLEELSGKNTMSESHAVCSKNPVGYGDRKRRNINVLVTSGYLVPSLVKCLLFRLDGVISKENVFSSWDVGKLQCFKWIKEKYNGPTVRFCAIGDGIEECSAAEKMGWPFVKFELQPHSRYGFPGLSTKMLECHMDAVYGVASSKDRCHEDDDS